MNSLTTRAILRALAVCALAARTFPALAGDVSITVSPTTNPGPALMTIAVADDVFNMMFASATPSLIKRGMIADQLSDHGYGVSLFGPGSLPFDGLVIHTPPDESTVSINTGGTGSILESITAAGVGNATVSFTGHLLPFDAIGEPAIFTAGIITDVGQLTVQIPASELMFQTDGPIICQALFQRLAPRAPQYGAQINYAGDRLEIYFDPAYTFSSGGIIFGTTSLSQGCTGGIIVPSNPPVCPIDFNGDGQIDFLDYLEFLNLYDAQDPRADLNGDGQVDFADYLEFLNSFDRQCR